MIRLKSHSPPPAGGPRPRLHRAQQGTTNRVGVFVDHLNRAIPFSLSHKGQIASQPRVATARLKRRATAAGVRADARLSTTWPIPGHSLRATGGGAAMGNLAQWTDAGRSMGHTMPPNGSREAGQEAKFDYEPVREREAHVSDPLKTRWQNGVNTKVTTPQEIGWRRVTDYSLNPVAHRDQAKVRESLVKTARSSRSESASADILTRTQRINMVRDSHFHTTVVHGPLGGRGDVSQRSQNRQIPQLLPPERVREHNDYMHQLTNREKQAFSIDGWGCSAKVKFDAFPVSKFEPDISALFTSRIVPPEEQQPTGKFSTNNPRARAHPHPDEVVKWDAFTEKSTQRLKKETAAAEALISRVTQGEGDGEACEARGMQLLQDRFLKKYSNADAVKIITDSEAAEGIMKGVISTQSNYKRPFSPANFSQLTTTKLGRPAGTAPIGLGLTAAAGLPTSLRYNNAAEALQARDFTVTAKGYNNTCFPAHSGHHVEGYVKAQRVPLFGGWLSASERDTWRELPNGRPRPSFDKGVEYDGQLKPGRRARDLTIYNTYNGMTN